MAAGTTKKNTTTKAQLENLNTLLLLFPAQELQSFYAEYSKQMLLTTTTQIERSQAIEKLLQILAEN